ncbi:MAG: carboxypeptidase regulatory-like domain-containing protein [Pseudomarimonas sp.]
MNSKHPVNAVKPQNRRKRPLLVMVALALATRLAFAADTATLSVYVFDQRTPLANAEVWIDGAVKGRTSSDGALLLQLPAGQHRLEVKRADEAVVALDLELKESENAELIATLYPDAAPSLMIESSHQDGNTVVDAAAQAAAGPPGTFTGRIINGEDGKPVANARVFISGTPLDVSTDADGNFSVPIAAGTYSISVIASSFATITLYDIAIEAGKSTDRPIELTPSGTELPEFVVLEPFVEGSLAAFVEERRESSAVTDILGAEQISRAGDSDAAGALKRVTGLTLVDGKYIYVRGLGERYSSTLLNGAQVPSPDPTRRVVPLDLFPTEVLSGIVVQKTYTADMPAEFGGGTIQLRTRGVPESFFVRAALNLGYADGTTGEDGLRYDGGRRDWTGSDDGTREAPLLFANDRLPSDPTELQALGRELAAQGYNTRTDKLPPNGSLGVGIGDNFVFSDGELQLGYIAAVRYAHAWDDRTEQRATYSLFGERLIPSETFERRKTERSIDSSVFLAFGLKVGELHTVDLTATRLRQTVDETEVDEGILSSGNLDRVTNLEWVENALDTVQLAGEHSFPGLGGLHASWQATQADAGRDAPNSREYRFTFDEALQDFFFESFNQQRFESLADEASDYRLDLKYPLTFGENLALSLQAGASQFERDRVSSIRRFRFSGRRPPGFFNDFEALLAPENIGPNGLQLQEGTQSSDAYTASQALDARYFAVDATWRQLSANLGVRREDILQTVTTVRPFDPDATPEVGVLDNSDNLPAGSLTWAYSEKAQVRMAYSSTLSRPDIREQTRANFVDPQLDVRVEGNPELKQAEIENIDLRWEYYFNALESFSVALFSKEFTNPIELVSVPASGNLLQIRNAESATNVGIEFDVYKSLAPVGSLSWMPKFASNLPWSDIYFGANYAKIESEIDLGDNQGIQTNAVRPLQGQSKYVANASLSYLHPEGFTEATLLFNVFGERISRVGVSGLPDVLEQPFRQLDFTISQQLPWQQWKLKLRLRNLLDPAVNFTQGGESTRQFKKGREAAISVEWKF